MATVVHSVHCMMGLDSLPATAGTEMSVEEQVDRLFMVSKELTLLEVQCIHLYNRRQGSVDHLLFLSCLHGEII